MVSFDVMTITANSLRRLLEDGTITSVQIVETYLSHIEEHTKAGAKCRAVISTPPITQVLSQASDLDKDHIYGRIRRPLQRMPSLLKVN